MHPICTLDNLDEGFVVGRAANQIPRFAGLLTKKEVELGGLEPPTSWVRSRRSPN
jgi:hypothetical protein